jgi:hypothetical protein
MCGQRPQSATAAVARPTTPAAAWPSQACAHTQAAPQLVVERSVGHVTAADSYIAWSHPGRCQSEAAFDRLAGTAPVPATCGQNQTRHRLNRGGQRPGLRDCSGYWVTAAGAVGV